MGGFKTTPSPRGRKMVLPNNCECEVFGEAFAFARLKSVASDTESYEQQRCYVQSQSAGS